MQIIAHRRNEISELIGTETNYGVEVDIRLSNSKLICQHDPLSDGPLFSDWISEYRHKTLILNVKEEGIEHLVLEQIKKFGISDYFFLDQSFPFLLKNAKTGLRNAAVRVSEFESIETAISLSGLIDWVWVDIFSTFPLGPTEISRLTNAGFKICVVSPELHGRMDENLVTELKNQFALMDFIPDAVCTKFGHLWEGK